LSGPLSPPAAKALTASESHRSNQIAGNLIASDGVTIHMSGGAQAKNVFWQVAGLVTLGTTSHFEGIVLSKTLIAMKTGASVNGRLFSQTAVTLEKNKVTEK
jgi:hypothetical protein